MHPALSAVLPRAFPRPLASVTLFVGFALEAMRVTKGSRQVICLIAAALALGATTGCRPLTDREVYREGQAGTVTLTNRSELTGYLPGCQPFAYEKLVEREWVEQPPDFVCFWEGFARPVPPASELALGFTARDEGRWRLRFDGGVGCVDNLPLSQANCRGLVTVVSNEFDVERRERADCVVSGCSSELCGPEAWASPCVFLPQYACFRDAVCSASGTLGPMSGCGWELDDELRECLAGF